MPSAFQELIAHQYEAALCTLSLGIDKCPEPAWNAPVVNYRFCQAAFHALFFADYYLGQNEHSFREQPFHKEHPEIFRGYEEFADHAPVLLYDRPSVNAYLQHCRTKASEVISSETEATLVSPAGFSRRASLSRAELHVYNIRHLQHHAAQLSLRLRIDFGVDIPWVGSGWREL